MKEKNTENYTKFYLSSQRRIYGLPKKAVVLLFALLDLTSKAGVTKQVGGMTVSIQGDHEPLIMEMSGIKTTKTLKKYLSVLVDFDIIRSVGYCTYQVNPYIFGIGEWEDILNVRRIWDKERGEN